MGHADHFLRRLDRVSDAHVELALTLYRDEELLREVLSRADLPDGVDRLAVSLDDPIEGPFVILTRGGHFVTCLGRGMRVGAQDLVVLSRERLDTAAAKVERMRERLAEVAALEAAGGEGVAARAFRRMQVDPFRFPREQAELLLGVLPLVARECAVTLFELTPAILDAQRQIANLRFDRLSGADANFALAFGNALCAMAHLLAFTDHEDAYAVTETLSRRRIEHGGADAKDERILPCGFALGAGTYAHALRALWAIGRRGKKILPALKAFDPTWVASGEIVRELGLATVALASPKLRAEASKAIRQLPKGVDPSTLEPSSENVSCLIGAFARLALDDPDRADADYVATARIAAARILHERDEVSPEEAAEVPEDLVRAVYPGTLVSWFGRERQFLATTSSALPFLARARPEELFLPESFLERLPPHSLETVVGIVEPFAKRYGLERPAPRKREAPKIGRNAPCPCGSGRKHKRCCGLARVT
jgi:hypothetical protein